MNPPGTVLTIVTSLLAAGFLLFPGRLAATEQPPEKIDLAPRSADQSHDRSVPSISRKPERVVQFELTEEYEQGILPAGRRVGLIVRLLTEPGKSPPANLVAILEGADSARTLISLSPGKDQGILEATASIELPALAERNDSDASAPGAEPPSVQMVRINVTFARLQGLRLESLFRRRIYFALGRNSSGHTTPRDGSIAPGEVQIDAATISTAPEGDPPSVPGIVDHVVLETDLVQGRPGSNDVEDYWRVLGRRIRDRWIERNPAVLREKTARTPRVRFRLYPSGIPQMMYLERSSGSPHVDVLGLESVLFTQPFPPFPAHMKEPYVNVHIHFRAGTVSR